MWKDLLSRDAFPNYNKTDKEGTAFLVACHASETCLN
jgi:hypothetical protein